MCIHKVMLNSVVRRGLKLSKALGTSNPVKTAIKTDIKAAQNVPVSFVRQNISKSEQMIDEFLAANSDCNERVEFLSVKLFKKMKSTGKNYVLTNEVRPLEEVTGLTEHELAQNFDNVASFLSGLKEGSPSLFYRDIPYRINFNMGKNMAQITPIGRGCSGTVYQVTIQGSPKKYVLKKYHGNEFNISRLEGAYNEAAIQHKMTEECVDDVAKLVISNPENGWILSEYIDKTYKASGKGISLEHFMKKHNLKFDDINAGMYVQDASGKNILVDFGWIIHPDSLSSKGSLFLDNLVGQINSERKVINYEKLLKRYMDNPKDRFKIIQQLEANADNDTCKMFYEKVKDTPQMQLYTKYSKYICLNKNGYESNVTIDELSNLMKESGFYGQICEFMGFQDFYNAGSLQFNDYLSPIVEKQLASLL